LERMPFGKHKGDLFTDIPYGYLKWLSGPSGPKDDPDVLFTVERTIKGRYS